MKRIFKIITVFIIGIICGYYVNTNIQIKNIFKPCYKAFQVGVYTDYEVANLYSTKYNNSIIVKDNELYRVYVAILKNQKNIEDMITYLTNKDIDFYLKDIRVENIDVKKEIENYEAIMNNESEIIFLEINRKIMETYKESL